jgi:hypothetical protein
MMHCPMCKRPSHKKKTLHLEDGSKEIFYQCPNLECSTTFITKEAFNHIIQDSKITLRKRQHYAENTSASL